MLSQGSLRIHFEDLAEHIRRHFQSLTHSLGTEALSRDLRTHGLLHRDSSGYFEFAHKGFAEYFVALKLGAEVGCLSSRFTSTYRDLEELRETKLPYRKKPAPELVGTFGRMPFANQDMTVVCDLLAGMMDGNTVDRLWEVLKETGTASPESMSTISSNALMLLTRRGEVFRGRDLSGALLADAELPHDLRQMNLFGARVFAGMAHRDLRGSDLTGAWFRPGALVGADLRGASGLDHRLCSAVITVPPSPRTFQPTAGLAAIQGFLQALPERVCWLVGGRSTGKTSGLLFAIDRCGEQQKPFFYFSGTSHYQMTAEDMRRRLASPEYDLCEQLSTFLSLFGYNRSRDLISAADNFAEMKQEVWKAFAADLQQLDCLIALDDAERPECKEFVTYLLGESEALRAVVMLASREQLVNTGTVIPMETPLSVQPERGDEFGHQPGEFTRMFGSTGDPPNLPEFAPPLPRAYAPQGPSEYTLLITMPKLPPDPLLSPPAGATNTFIWNPPASAPSNDEPGEATRMFEARWWPQPPKIPNPPGNDDK